MASSKAPQPSTPTQQITTPKPASPSTGTWRHPRFDEIARRQAVTTFTDQNVHRILWNTGTLIFSFVAITIASRNDTAERILHNYLAHPYIAYPLLLFRLLLVFNIAIAVFPLFREKDEMNDIPLTPSQRALLGLNPSSSTKHGTTPTAQFITPPRYAVASTTRSTPRLPGSRGSPHGSSPLSGKGSSSGGRGSPSAGRVPLGSGSPFTPGGNSPMWQRAIAGSAGRDSAERRKESYASPSPLGASTSVANNGMGLVGTPGTPSPSGGRAGVSVPLNSRWLYEKGGKNMGSPSAGRSRLFA